MPPVSIVMSTYNQVQYIDEAVQGIIQQTYPEFEFIIVNNGSTDGTKEYLDKLTDPRIRVIHKEHEMAVCGINRGVSEAKCDLISWISSDNICSKYFIEAFLTTFNKNQDLDYIYSAYWNINDSGKITSVINHNSLSYRNLVFNRNNGNASFMYRRKIHDDVGLYDESIRYSCDTDMWAKIFRSYKIGYIIEPLHYYRYHDAQETAIAGKGNKFSEETAMMTSRYWHGMMGGRISDIVHDFYPKLSPSSPKDHFFYCLWSLAASFYNYANGANIARAIIEHGLRLTPATHLADTLHFYIGSLEDHHLAQAPATIKAQLSLNQNLSGEGVDLADMLLEQRRKTGKAPYIIMMPREDVAKIYERDPVRVLSFLEYT